MLTVVQFRNLDVPTSVRLGELLTHLQGKGEEACREFYRALHLHVEEVYYSLPTRLHLRGSSLKWLILISYHFHTYQFFLEVMGSNCGYICRHILHFIPSCFQIPWIRSNFHRSSNRDMLLMTEVRFGGRVKN